MRQKNGVFNAPSILVVKTNVRKRLSIIRYGLIYRIHRKHHVFGG